LTEVLGSPLQVGKVESLIVQRVRELVRHDHVSDHFWIRLA
jgi:hypothetical protein